MRRQQLTQVLFACLVLALVAVAPADDQVKFSTHVRPILAAKCWQCHGPDKNTREGDLRLDDREAAVRVLEPNKESTVELVERITADDADMRMPPADSKKPLTETEIKILQRWIEQGAPFESHWAFQSPTRPEVPVKVDRTKAIDLSLIHI